MRPSRKVLRLICTLTGVGGGVMIGVGVEFVTRAQLYGSAGLLYFLGGLVVLLSLVGFAGAGREKSSMLMTFFFGNFFLITSLFVASYAAFSFQDSLATWLKHHWSDLSLQHTLRRHKCCSQFTDALDFFKARFVVLGVVSSLCIVLLLAALYCVVRIVTIPIVMKNLLMVINFIFILLGAGIFSYGFHAKAHDDVAAGQQWIAVVFIVVGTLVIGLSAVGIVGSRSKSRTLLLIYILGIGACLAVLFASAIGAFTFSDRIVSSYDSLKFEDLACEAQLSDCSNCTSIGSSDSTCPGVARDSQGFWQNCTQLTNAEKCQMGKVVLNQPADQGYEPNDIGECRRCPQWSDHDVHSYVQSSLQLMGLFAAVVCFYIIVGFAAALVLRRSLAGYQTDSI